MIFLSRSALSTVFLQGLWTLAFAEDPSTYFGGGREGSYFSWLQSASYSKTSFLESSSEVGMGVALHWTINGNTIQLAVAAKATGWVGFGLGETGSMLGADVILFSAASNELIDAHVLDQAVMPIKDDCPSWTLVNSQVDGDFIIFEATRLLDTGDSQDRIIGEDSDVVIPPTRVLAAWGDETDPTHHGLRIARGAIRFFGNSSTSDELLVFASSMKAEAEGNFTIEAKNFVIPTDRTTYHYVCLSRNEILSMNINLDQDLHTIGIEPFIDPRTKQFVHHFVLSGSAYPWNASLLCEDYFDIERLYIWAPGTTPFALPPNVGGPLGLNGFQSFQLEIHYNNPTGIANLVDSSGVRLYYTSKKREHDMGVFQTGDPMVALEGNPVSVNNGLAQHIFYCGSTCFSHFLNEPVTVFREHFHMHASGVSAANAQIRNQQVVHESKVEYWDFKQQGNVAVAQPPYEIHAGDSFVTTCNYNAVNNETWGDGSKNEMCIAFLYYYPRRTIDTEFGEIPFMCGQGFDDFLPICAANHSVTPAFTEFDQLNREFGSPVSSCPATSDGSGKSGTPPSGTTPESSTRHGKTLPSAIVSLFFVFFTLSV